MRDILILFAKLNPAIRYVQGMNEVLAPIYYVFSTDTDKQNAVSTFLVETGYYVTSASSNTCSLDKVVD